MSNRVAIVGATGLVGEALLAILQQRSFPISELTLLASERSAGQTIDFNGKEYKVELLDNFDFKSIGFSFFSAGAAVSRVFAPKAANAGSVVIDNTSEFRYDDHIPLVIPEVNPHALKDFKKNNRGKQNWSCVFLGKWWTCCSKSLHSFCFSNYAF